MPATELLFLRSVKTGKGLQKLINNLQRQRKSEKQNDENRKPLSMIERQLVWNKTGGRCHLCGIKVRESGFHADHIHPHTKGGAHSISNYLPSCAVCNHLRWHYGPEEIQLMLRLGRWLKTELVKEKDESLELANRFVKQLMRRRKERKGRNGYT